MRYVLLLLFLASPVAASDVDDAAAALALAAARRHTQEQTPVKPTAPHVGYKEFCDWLREYPGEVGELFVGLPVQGGYVKQCYVPSGYLGIADGRWWCYADKDGKLWMKKEEVSRSASPFSTLGITVPPAVAPSTSSPAISRTGGTRILVPSMGRFGRIENCGPIG